VKIDEIAEKVAREYSLRRGWEPEDWDNPTMTNRDDIIADMRAAIEAAVGDMVLVPRETTLEMVEAGEEVIHEVLSGFMSHGAQVDRLWAALLAAANGEGEN